MGNKFSHLNNVQNKETFNKCFNKPISPPNRHSLLELRVPRKLSTNENELKT